MSGRVAPSDGSSRSLSPAGPRRVPVFVDGQPLAAPLGLVPSKVGHVATGAAPPPVSEALIEAFLEGVNACYRWSKAETRESGFLLYAREGEGGAVAEPIAYGKQFEISWHWAYREATVAASFHTHPNVGSAPVPSGIDLLGALVRGDHVHYILTMDGRLVGWRFRDPRRHPRAIDDALRALSDARAMTRPFLGFLEMALERMVDQVATPVYAAQLTLLDDGGLHLKRKRPSTLLEGWKRA